MATAKQQLGSLGEKLVVQNCACPRCKRAGTLKTLPLNFKCADVICDFCGYLAQVKAKTSPDGVTPPGIIPGAAWAPQQARMQAGIYFPLFLVLVAPAIGRFSIHYLSADLQGPDLFIEREPLRAGAQKEGWTGFRYNLASVRDRLVLIAEGRLAVRRPKPPLQPAVSPAA
jgi:type II restriction enzyme